MMNLTILIIEIMNLEMTTILKNKMIIEVRKKKLKDSIKDALDSIDSGEVKEQEGDDSGANWG